MGLHRMVQGIYDIAIIQDGLLVANIQLIDINMSLYLYIQYLEPRKLKLRKTKKNY